MMKSESEAALSGDGIPLYLRAYGSPSARGRLGHGYDSIGGNRSDQRGGSSGDAGGLLDARRALGVVAVFIAFAMSVSMFSSRWTAGEWGPAGPVPPLPGGSYREIVESGFGAPSSQDNLTLMVTNEYGEFDRRALAMYGLDVVVEPYRETTIAVEHPDAWSSRFYWLLVRTDESGMPMENVEADIDAKGGRFATIMLTEPGGTYALVVRQLRADGSTAAERRATITCKYVRRELRELTEGDRTAFFLAMREFYTVSLDEGAQKYGAGFANAKLVTAVHNSQNYCFHNGMHFLNAHASFDLWVERSLQMIDPTVSLTYWDFMLDAANLGTNWTSSEIFGADMFGSAIGSPDNNFQISDGWFANITSAYDPDDDLVDETISTNHNPYGFVDASANYQDVPGVIRTHSYCGLEGKDEFAQCDSFVNCFESNDNLYDWSVCMELQVHAAIHGMLGGGFGCNVNMADFQSENPEYSSELLTFALEFLLANKWPSNSLMQDYNECDESCTKGQAEPCGCTCTIDPFDLSDNEVYDFMEGVMETLSGRLHGERYVDEDTSVRNKLGFMQDGNRLEEESTMLLLRQMMVIGCEPGSVGAMSTGASPLDPIFWVLHPMFEKALHIVELSPGYRDTYDFTWVDSECGGKIGGKLNDAVPFTEQSLGLGEGSEMLTNEEIAALLHPSNPELPYLFEGFEKWGTCTDWDPCPECVVGALLVEGEDMAPEASRYNR